MSPIDVSYLSESLILSVLVLFPSFVFGWMLNGGDPRELWSRR